MADSALLSQEEQRRNQEDQQAQQQAALASLYGGAGAPGYGGLNPGFGSYGPDYAPSYGTGTGGVAPRRDDAFTQYVSHMHGAGALRTGRYTKGPYRGMEPDEAQEAMHDDWLKMSPEARVPFYQREFGADTVDPNNPGGYFSKEQQNQVAPGFDKQFSALQSRVGGAPGSAPNYVSSDPFAGFNPGSMNGDSDLSNRGRSGPIHNDMSALTPNDSASSSYHGPDATPTGQIFKPTPANLVATQAPSSLNMPMPARPASMGNPFNVAQFGPRYSGATLAPSIAGAVGATPPGIIPHPDFNPGQQPPSYAPIPAPPRAMASLG